MPVIVDAVDAEGATCRTQADAPEIDGNLFIDEGFDRAVARRHRHRRGRGGGRLRPLGPGTASKNVALGQACGTAADAAPSCAASQHAQPSVQAQPRQRVTTSAQSPWVIRPSSSAL
jgi:hypothetical protein